MYVYVYVYVAMCVCEAMYVCVWVCVCEWVCACMRSCMRECVRACARECVRLCVCVWQTAVYVSLMGLVQVRLQVSTPLPWDMVQPHLQGTSPPPSGFASTDSQHPISAQALQCFTGLAWPLSGSWRLFFAFLRVHACMRPCAFLHVN